MYAVQVRLHVRDLRVGPRVHGLGGVDRANGRAHAAPEAAPALLQRVGR